VKDSTLKRSGDSPIHPRECSCVSLSGKRFALPHQRGTCLSLLATHYISVCTTFRHRHFGLSSPIEIAEVEEGNAEMGERKKQRVKRRIEPSDARAAHVADYFWFLCLFARPGNNVCPALARVRSKRQRKRADEAGKQAIRLLHPKETAVGLCLPRRAEARRGAANASCWIYFR
jgi:hypothetical protein